MNISELVTPFKLIIDSVGVSNLAKAIFEKVEATYVRRSTYEADTAVLVSHIDKLERMLMYNLRLTEDGHLVLNLQDGETDPTTAINGSGHLTITADQDAATQVEKFISGITFSINSNGDLVASY